VISMGEVTKASVEKDDSSGLFYLVFEFPAVAELSASRVAFELPLVAGFIVVGGIKKACLLM